LINSIKVYQQSGSSPILSQAEDSSNQTGAGGPVPHSSGSPRIAQTTLLGVGSIWWIFVSGGLYVLGTLVL
jgi:hypothetical protein